MLSTHDASSETGDASTHDACLRCDELSVAVDSKQKAAVF